MVILESTTAGEVDGGGFYERIATAGVVAEPITTTPHEAMLLSLLHLP